VTPPTSSPPTPPVGPDGGPPGGPLAGFAPGHPAVARVVLDGLQRLTTSPDPDLSRWATDVLAGRASVRDVPGGSVGAAAEAAAQRLAALDDDQRAALAERGRALAEDLLRGGSGRGTRHG